MRPIKLTMKGFGPYAKETVVDFEKLGDKGIYLITGATGTGKTTIFDAIVYALYNRTSGSLRDADMLRSKYALDTDPTEVTLEFAYGGKKYKVTRSPRYSRAMKNREGTTEQPPKAELVLDDGSIVYKTTDVTNKITEIIGLDSDQFCKISMLAQGEFRKILTDDSKTRTEIFRKLFHTEKYYRLQEELKKRSSQAAREGGENQARIAQFAEGIVCREDSYYEAQVKKAKANELTGEDLLEVLEKIIQEDKDAEETLRDELKKFDKIRQDLAADEKMGQSQEAMRITIADGEKKLQELGENKSVLEGKLKEAEAKLPEAKEKRNEIARIKAQLDQYDELEEALSEKEKNEKDIEKSKNSIENLKATSQADEEKLKTDKETLSGLSGAEGEKASAEAEYEKGQTRYGQVQDLEEDQRAYINKEGNLQKALDSYKKKSQDEAAKRADFDSKRKAYLDDQAGILAEELEDGTPCLVCGAVHHPKPAEKAQNAPTREELDLAEKTYEEARKSTENAANEVGSLKTECGILAENFIKEYGEIFGEKLEAEASPDRKLKAEDILDQELLTSKEAEAQAELRTLKKKLDEASDKVDAKKRLEEELPLLEQRVRNAQTEINQLEQDLAGQEAKGEALDKQVANLRDRLEYESKAKADEAAKALDKAAGAIEENHADCKEALDKNQLESEKTKAVVDDNSKTLEGQKPIDLDKTREELKEANDRRDDIGDKQRSVSGRLSSNTYAYDNIKDKLAESAELSKKIAMIKELCETATGDVVKKDKIPLETYIQMTYFDRILDKANLRLAIMTNNQYAMVRREENAGGKRKAGLDIDVIDNFNGSQRSASTLSGGELFKASLCLALGMADEVSESAGGIKIDSLFVDEGFGSLDPESINKAMDALETIAEGDRLVGIISHVEELQGRIEKQIVISREKDGSSAVKM